MHAIGRTTIGAALLAATVGVSMSPSSRIAAQDAPAAESMRFHHVHLNSVNPAAAAAS